jgi:hypothetical protein
MSSRHRRSLDPLRKKPTTIRLVVASVGRSRLVEEKGPNSQKEFVLGMIDLDRRMEKRAAKGETRSLDPQERLERTRRL